MGWPLSSVRFPDDQRLVLDDMMLIVDELRLLLQHLQVVLPARLRHDPLRAIARLRRECGQDALFVDGRVPDVEVRHPRIVAHVLAVTRYRRACRILARRLVAAEKARGHESAGGQAFQVPFPRSGQRLVEIVDRKNEVALRRCEHAEIADVRIPAGLDGHARYRRVRQVARHDGGRAAQKRKRADKHPRMADGHQKRPDASSPALRGWLPDLADRTQDDIPRAARAAPSRAWPCPRPCARPPMAEAR